MFQATKDNFSFFHPSTWFPFPSEPENCQEGCQEARKLMGLYAIPCDPTKRTGHLSDVTKPIKLFSINPNGTISYYGMSHPLPAHFNDILWRGPNFGEDPRTFIYNIAHKAMTMSFEKTHQQDTSQQSNCQDSCTQAQNLLGKWAIRCGPTKESKSHAYTVQAVYLVSIGVNNTIKAKGDCSLDIPEEFNDNQWREPTSSEAPAAYLKNRCIELNNTDDQSACFRNLSWYQQLFKDNRIDPFNEETMYSDLKFYCREVRSERVKSTCEDIVENLRECLSRKGLYPLGILPPTANPQSYLKVNKAK